MKHDLQKPLEIIKFISCVYSPCWVAKNHISDENNYNMIFIRLNPNVAKILAEKNYS